MKVIIIFILLVFFSFNSNCQVLTDVKCKLWTPKDYCDAPPSGSFHNIFNELGCDDCGLHTEECNKLNKPDLIGVSLTFTISSDYMFNVESKFKNIKLLRADGTKEFPEIILYNNRISDNLQEYILKIEQGCIESKLSQNKTYHLVMFFKKAKAGDKLIIDNFVNTIITK